MLNDHKKEILNNESSSTPKAVIFLMLSNAQFFNLFFNQFTLKSDNQNQKKRRVAFHQREDFQNIFTSKESE